MEYRIDTTEGRKALKPRREPYWYRVSEGAFLGYRKLQEGAGTWIARWRGEDGKQRYHALGEHDHIDAAQKEASAWFAQCEGGGPEVLSVEDVCKRYVADRRVEKGSKTAADAEGRFKRHVYGKPIGRIELQKLKTGDVKAWLHGLLAISSDDPEDDPDAERRAKDSANRNLGSFKAALNFGYRHGHGHGYGNYSFRHDKSGGQRAPAESSDIHAQTRLQVVSLTSGAWKMCMGRVDIWQRPGAVTPPIWIPHL